MMATTLYPLIFVKLLLYVNISRKKFSRPAWSRTRVSWYLRITITKARKDSRYPTGLYYRRLFFRVMNLAVTIGTYRCTLSYFSLNRLFRMTTVHHSRNYHCFIFSILMMKLNTCWVVFTTFNTLELFFIFIEPYSYLFPSNSGTSLFGLFVPLIPLSLTSILVLSVLICYTNTY